MIRNFPMTCVGLLCAVSTSFVSANDCCYDICDTDYGTFGVHAEYLFWTTEIPCLDYVQQLTYPVETVTVDNEQFQRVGTLSSQELSRLNHKWRSGFRVGADYKCSLEDPWRYAAYYTYFRSHDDATRVAPDPVAGFLTNLQPSIPFFFVGVPIPQIQQIYQITAFLEGDAEGRNLRKADSHTHLRLDFGDAEVTRINCLCGPATFNVLVGVRGGYIRNNWNTSYYFQDDNIQTDFEGFIDVFAKTRNNWSFLSIGPRIGGQFDWCLGYGFSLYVDASLSALWGKVKNRVKSTLAGSYFEQQSTGADPLTTPFVVVQEDLCRHRHKSVPLFQGEAGLAWFMTCENFVVDAKIGVELLHFVNLAENFHYPIPFSNKFGSIRSVDLYGLTLGVGVLF